MRSFGDLLDANVWLALAAEAHTHHQVAKAYWEHEAAPIAAFCRVTQMAFLRLLTNKAVMGGQVLSPSAAWAKSTDFLSLPEVELRVEPAGLEETWGRFSTSGRSSPNLWTDAYLAAFAVSAGLRLVTFDKGFSTFDGLDRLTLQEVLRLEGGRWVLLGTHSEAEMVGAEPFEAVEIELTAPWPDPPGAVR